MWAEALAPFAAGIRIDCVTLTEGPFGIESQRDVDQVALPLAALIEARADAAAFVIACYSDPGIDLCRETARVPVFGIQESGVLTALARGDRVELRGFGAFSVKKRDSRVGRNPRTGETVHVEEKHVPFFKTGKLLRDRLNGQE